MSLNDFLDDMDEDLIALEKEMDNMNIGNQNPVPAAQSNQ